MALAEDTLDALRTTGLAEIDPFVEWLQQGIALHQRARMAKAQLAPANEEKRVA